MGGKLSAKVKSWRENCRQVKTISGGIPIPGAENSIYPPIKLLLSHSSATPNSLFSSGYSSFFVFETPMESQPNGIRYPLVDCLLRRTQPLHCHPSSPSKSADSIYKECVKNHAAKIGGFALDGCGGYIACPSSPLSLKCEIRGCHRNFHRSDPNYHLYYYAPPPAPFGLNIHNLNSTSPPPFIPSFYPPSPYMVQTENNLYNSNNGQSEFHAGSSGIKKRFRTKFSSEQKVKMQDLAEKLRWKMRKAEKDMIEISCRQIGDERSVLKIWMHNHKNTLGKRDVPGNGVDCDNEDTIGHPLFEGNNDIIGLEHENVANVSSSSFP